MNIANALARLFPNANPLRDYIIQDDGDGARIVAWNLPDPQPTPATLQAASAAYDLALAQSATEAQALRAQVATVASSAVGVVISNLTAIQVRAVLAVLLWKGGALDKDGKIRPLSEWGDA